MRLGMRVIIPQSPRACPPAERQRADSRDWIRPMSRSVTAVAAIAVAIAVAIAAQADVTGVVAARR